MAHAVCGAPIFPRMAEDPADLEPRMQRLVTFLGAGFRAPTTADKEK